MEDDPKVGPKATRGARSVVSHYTTDVLHTSAHTHTHIKAVRLLHAEALEAGVIRSRAQTKEMAKTHPNLMHTCSRNSGQWHLHQSHERAAT